MKRGGPLTRRSELRPDPEKVREFLARGRGQLSRVARRRAPEGPLSPGEWRVRVFESSGGRCIISGAEARDAEDRRFHAHHCLPKRVLRVRGLGAYVWDPRNGVWMRSDVHELHENASRRVPWTALPPAVWEFCGELDALDGSQWASSLVLRLHPAR